MSAALRSLPPDQHDDDPRERRMGFLSVLFPALMTFYGEFSSAPEVMPGVEETVDLYLNMMLGMVVVFQIPTMVFFLAKMRLVCAERDFHSPGFPTYSP